jgi:trehalose utilization protein
MSKIRVLIWCDNRVDDGTRDMLRVYPRGVHQHLAGALNSIPDFDIMTATMEMKEHGLPAYVLDQLDVLVWWAHMDHELVELEVVDRIYTRIMEQGMGLVCLHSSHFSLIFKRLMGTSCNLKWRHGAEKERIWVVEPTHPVASGLPEYFEIAEAEMYGERFDIPTPDSLVFISWFEGGEIFRSGCAFHRGRGKVFYFRPGHGTYRVYDHPLVIKVIENSIRWAAPVKPAKVAFGEHEVMR